MDKLDKVRKEVHRLYTKKKQATDGLIEWIYQSHVLVVAKNAEYLAKESKADVVYSVAGALLHDIADTEMDRSNPQHEARSVDIAREVLSKSGFSKENIEEIIKEVISPHSCTHTMPTLLEGKVLATADALAHFQTEFYTYFAWNHLGANNYKEFKHWVLEKVERDLNKKIFFASSKKKIRKEYEAIKLLFSK